MNALRNVLGLRMLSVNIDAILKKSLLVKMFGNGYRRMELRQNWQTDRI